MVVCGGVSAQPVDARVAALDSADYSDRVEATEALLIDATLDAATLRGWYDDAASPEVRQRLLAVLRHRVVTGLREARFGGGGPGSLGVVYRVEPLAEGVAMDGDELTREGARVLRTLPGFPAEGVLRPGDRIVAVDGRNVRGRGQRGLEEELKRSGAGDTVRLFVMRGERGLTLPVTLASSRALAAMYDPLDISLRPEFDAAWRPAEADGG